MSEGIGARSVLAAAAVAASLAVAPALARADVWGTTFEAPSYTAGDIDGQGNWTNAGGYDANVADVSSFAAAADYGFGSKALQISNAKTSGSYTDQTYAPRLYDEAGEAAAVSNGISGGIRQPHFDAQFRIGTAEATQQPGDLQLRVSPDQGEGARMSYLRFEDAHADGVHVIFKDLPNGTTSGGHVNFVDNDIATLSRGSSHLIAYSVDLNDGPDNDIVRVFIDGVLKATGHSWEEYYRNDTEAGPDNEVPTISTLGFVQTGTQDVGNAGKGFLVDDVRFASSTPGANAGPQGAQGQQGQQGQQGPQGQGVAQGQAGATPVAILTKALTADKRGRVKVKLSCPPADGLCDGRLKLALGRRQVGYAEFTINGNKTQTIRVRLSRSALKRLAHRSRTLTASVFSRDLRGNASRTSAHLKAAKLAKR